MASRRSYEQPSDRLTALEIRLDEVERTLEKIGDQLKWQTRAMIGTMLTIIGSLSIALMVFK